MGNVDESEIDFADMQDPARDVYFEPETRALIRTEDVWQAETEVGTVGYSDKLLGIIANYRNSGKPDGYNAQCMVGKSKKGEVALRLFAVVNPKTEMFERAGFQTRGCLAVTACASVLCTLIEGKTFAEALAISVDDIREAVGGVPWDKSYTPYFAYEGVRALVGDYYFKRGISLEDFNARGICDDAAVSCILCENCSLRTTRVEALTDERLSGNDARACVREAIGGPGGEHACAPAQRSDHPKAHAPAAVATGDHPRGSSLACTEAAGAMAQTGSAAVCESPCEEESIEDRELAEHNALARVFDDVRAQSAASLLVTPERWEAAGFVPAHMTGEDFEMFVYDWIPANVDGADAIARTGADGKGGADDAWENPHVKSSFRTAARMVGVPSWFEKPAGGDVADPQGSDDFVSCCGDSDGASDADPSTPDQALPAAIREQTSSAPAVGAEPRPISSPRDTVFGKLKIPEGYKLVELEGEFALVETDETDPVERLEIKADRIRMLVGEFSYYLYDNAVMTDRYAHWAYLAAEDDDKTTFADCVRDESRTYPRPMPATTLQNPPFGKSADEVQAIWEELRDSGAYPDIKRIVASNGDAYFYSTDYLSDAYASSLAEYDAVERKLNV